MISAILNGLPLLGGLWSTVFGDKTKKQQSEHVEEMATHTEQLAIYKQFANEFGHSKTLWDSLIDGINRLPRPTMTFGVIWLFYHCWTDPMAFLEGVTALQAMPQEGWWILGIIITFWFGGKMQKDFGKMTSQHNMSRVVSNLQKVKNLDKVDDSLPWLDEKHNEDITFAEKINKRYSKSDAEYPKPRRN